MKMFIFFLILYIVVITNGLEYQLHDHVPVFVNSVGPFNNLAETYKYYSLPFCQPKDFNNKHHNKEKLGEVLAGDRHQDSLYDIRYLVDIQWQSLCDITLTQDDIKLFTDSINEHYIFEMYIDDLYVRGFVGEHVTESSKYDHHIHNETTIYLYIFDLK